MTPSESVAGAVWRSCSAGWLAGNLRDQVLAPEIIALLGRQGLRLIARDCQRWHQFNGLFVRDEVARLPGIAAAVAAFRASVLAKLED